MAKLKPDFDKRNVKIIGLSVDPVDRHKGWAKDIEETQGHAPNYPMIGDPDALDLQALRHAARRRRRHVGGPHRRRQPDGAQRLRHRPRQEDQAAHRLSDDHRAELRRGAPRHRFAPAHRQAQGVDAGELEARARTSSSPARSPTTTPRRSGPPAGRSRSPTSASSPSRAAERTGFRRGAGTHPRS